MKKDITNRHDIEKLIIHFYEKVKSNDVIGFIFTTVVNMDWERHIPVIVDFWETILLDNPVYRKNAMQIHFELDKVIPLQKVHFDAWLSLFTSSVDELYEGRVAELAKARAKSIGAVMHFKIEGIHSKQPLN